MEFSFILHKASRYLNIQRSLSIFLFKKWWKIPLSQSTKRGEKNRTTWVETEKIKNLWLFLYLPAVHLNVFPEAFSPSSSSSSSLLHLTATPNTTTTSHPWVPSLLSSLTTSCFQQQIHTSWNAKKKIYIFHPFSSLQHCTREAIKNLIPPKVVELWKLTKQLKLVVNT